jgi:D-3-phosphoglycerate dehydrogenase
MAIGMMVDLARKITDSAIEYRNGREAEPRKGVQLHGATLGIMGYGAIGRYLGTLGVALGMKVLVSDPFAKVEDAGLHQVPLETLLAQSDFVVCLVIANEETENLMNAANFARMKRSAYFLNLSRGNLVDEAALLAALETKQIAGAAMDVGRAFDQKPSLNLASRADVIATPHTAGLTPDAIEHQALDTVKQVAELVAKRVPPGAVNTAKATRLTRLGINDLT